MDSMTETLSKLASELTDRLAVLEQENAALVKEAAAYKEAQSAAPAPAVSEEVVDRTVDALVKAGALTEDQTAESRSVLLSDAEAPHRILQELLDVQTQAKTASAEVGENLDGGTVVGNNSMPRTDGDNDCLDRMAAILRRY